MAKKTNTADLGFEDKIWKAADLLRGSIDAAEYKNVVLGLCEEWSDNDDYATTQPAATERKMYPQQEEESMLDRAAEGLMAPNAAE